MSKATYLGDTNETDFEEVVCHGTIAKGDLVTIKTDAQAEVTAAGNPIYGLAEQAGTVGQTISVRRLRKGSKLLMDNDNVGTTFAATHVGGKFDTTGGTGAQLVDTSTVAQTGDDTGQLLCVAYNPQGYGVDTDTSFGIFEVNEAQ